MKSNYCIIDLQEILKTWVLGFKKKKKARVTGMIVIRNFSMLIFLIQEILKMSVLVLLGELFWVTEDI